jgi:hypothetical protein
LKGAVAVAAAAQGNGIRIGKEDRMIPIPSVRAGR